MCFSLLMLLCHSLLLHSRRLRVALPAETLKLLMLLLLCHSLLMLIRWVPDDLILQMLELVFMPLWLLRLRVVVFTALPVSSLWRLCFCSAAWRIEPFISRSLTLLIAGPSSLMKSFL